MRGLIPLLCALLFGAFAASQSKQLPGCNGCFAMVDGISYACCATMSNKNLSCICAGNVPCRQCAPAPTDKYRPLSSGQVHPFTDETTYLINDTPATLTLSYFSAVIGTFTTKPPQTVAPYSTVTWSMSGSIYDNFGWIEYDVYYQSNSFEGCTDLSYLWDLVVGVCNSGWTNCPTSVPKKRHPRRVMMKSAGPEDCYFWINDDCGGWSNPVHKITTNCTSKKVFVPQRA